MEDLGGEQFKFAPTISQWRNQQRELIGILCVHVDDFCFGGSPEFDEVVRKLAGSLKVGETQEKKFNYLGLQIQQR